MNILFNHPNRQQTIEAADRYFDFLENVFSKTPAQVRAENIDIEQKSMEIIKGNVVLDIFIPVLTKVNTLSYQSKTETQSLVGIIALLRYRQDKGPYPDDLEKLITAGYLKQLPMDPFSDRPLIYRKTGGEFILYSVGRNFIDDGGKPCKDKKGRIRLWGDDGDAVFWSVQSAQKTSQ